MRFVKQIILILNVELIKIICEQNQYWKEQSLDSLKMRLFVPHDYNTSKAEVWPNNFAELVPLPNIQTKDSTKVDKEFPYQRLKPNEAQNNIVVQSNADYDNPNNLITNVAENEGAVSILAKRNNIMSPKDVEDIKNLYKSKYGEDLQMDMPVHYVKDIKSETVPQFRAMNKFDSNINNNEKMNNLGTEYKTSNIENPSTRKIRLPFNHSLKHWNTPVKTRSNGDNYVADFFKKKLYERLAEKAGISEHGPLIKWCGCTRSCKDPISLWQFKDYSNSFYRQLTLANVFRCNLRKWIHDNVWYFRETLRNVIRPNKPFPNITYHPDMMKFLNKYRFDRTSYLQKPKAPLNQVEPIITHKVISQRGWIRARNGRIPLGSYSDGQTFNGRTIYVGRAAYLNPETNEYNLIPGMIVEKDDCIRFDWQGQEICQSDYEVLVGSQYTWVANQKQQFPLGYVVGGYESSENTKLGICRQIINNKLVISKLSLDTRRCQIAEETAGGSAEMSSRNYEILVDVFVNK